MLIREAETLTKSKNEYLRTATNADNIGASSFLIRKGEEAVIVIKVAINGG